MRLASRLNLTVGNSRLLILQATREPNLASQVLSAALRVLPAQWMLAHGYKPLIAEAFTDLETHHGTTYKVTHWTPLGQTKGFTRHHADFYVPNGRPKNSGAKNSALARASGSARSDCPPSCASPKSPLPTAAASSASAKHAACATCCARSPIRAAAATLTNSAPCWPGSKASTASCATSAP
jgi:hypothetical protein